MYHHFLINQSLVEETRNKLGKVAQKEKNIDEDHSHDNKQLGRIQIKKIKELNAFKNLNTR